MTKIVIIGAGIIGCSIARELSKYHCEIIVLEKFNDVACGTSKANSGIVHAGFDAQPNSFKSKFNVLGNAMFDKLSVDLDFPFYRNGAMVVCFDQSLSYKLAELYDKGIANGVKGLEVIDGEQARTKCPNLSDKVVGALYAPSSGIVGPYEMTLAYAENAYNNGVQFHFETRVINIAKSKENWLIECDNGNRYNADIIINCAGLYGDDINNFVAENKIKIIPRKGEYELLDKSEGYLTRHTLFQLPTQMGKGILITPTCHGNIIIGPTADDIEDKTNVNTTVAGLNKVFEMGQLTIPSLNKRSIIKQFSGLRAHGSTNDFNIGWVNQGFYNVVGIESPGLTAAPAIACHVADEIANTNSLSTNKNYNPMRKGIACFATMSDEERQAQIAINPLYGKIVCRCELVTEGEIVDAITRPLGASDLDGIKRRTRAGMGRCQAGFCTARCMEILAKHTNKDMTDITLFGKGSNLLVGRAKE